MRLIDADVLMEYFKRLSDECSSENNYEYSNLYDCVCAEIMTQPTAYDVEKVVAELEEFTKLAEDRWVNGTSNHAYQEHKCWVKAIDIVKSGGIDGKI